MTGWVLKEAAMAATHSVGLKSHIQGLGNMWIPCLIQVRFDKGDLLKEDQVYITIRAPLRTRVRLPVPKAAVMFEHRELRHAWPLVALPYFAIACYTARHSGRGDIAQRESTASATPGPGVRVPLSPPADIGGTM